MHAGGCGAPYAVPAVASPVPGPAPHLMRGPGSRALPACHAPPDQRTTFPHAPTHARVHTLASMRMCRCTPRVRTCIFTCMQPHAHARMHAMLTGLPKQSSEISAAPGRPTSLPAQEIQKAALEHKAAHPDADHAAVMGQKSVGHLRCRGAESSYSDRESWPSSAPSSSAHHRAPCVLRPTAGPHRTGRAVSGCP